jgi:hypothetical protein
VCKNVEKAVPNTIQSVNELGAKFVDYKVVIYENNSSDRTKELFREWAKDDSQVLFIWRLKVKKVLKRLKLKLAEQ